MREPLFVKNLLVRVNANSFICIAINQLLSCAQLFVTPWTAAQQRLVLEPTLFLLLCTKLHDSVPDKNPD